MKSSIKIEFKSIEGNGHTLPRGLEPVIHVSLDKWSDDVRDNLLKTFFEALGGKSSWLKVEYMDINSESPSPTYISILPVRPEELEETINIIRMRISNNNVSVLPSLEIGVSGLHLLDHINDEGRSWYRFSTTKSLKGLREGVLTEAMEKVINNPDNWIK